MAATLDGCDRAAPRLTLNYAVAVLALQRGLAGEVLLSNVRLVRVRRSYTRGQWTTPKSRRSSRAVPMADRVAGELKRRRSRACAGWA